MFSPKKGNGSCEQDGSIKELTLITMLVIIFGNIYIYQINNLYTLNLQDYMSIISQQSWKKTE